MTGYPDEKRLGFFTRLLDPADPAARYRAAIDQIRRAEELGYHSAWIAQHHFDGAEGGLPSPFVFLAQAAARTSRIRLGTGIVTLALESPLRVAEDAAVLDLMSDGRLELGLGTGGSAAAFEAFGLESAARGVIFGRNVELFLSALGGRALPGGARLYPQDPSLRERIWQATFSGAGAERAGRAGDGLMLSRTQPRPPEAPDLSLAEIQNPIVDAYLGALPPGRRPRILASRSVFVADDREEALRLSEIGLKRYAERLVDLGQPVPKGTLSEVIRASDLHVGTVEDVIASLRADTTLERATDIAVQVHAADPPHPYVLRSIELFATAVAPALGWTARAAEPSARQPARRAVGVGSGS